MDRRHLALTIAPLLASLVLVGCERQQGSKSTGEAMHLPAPGFVADATRGQGLFEANCATCHGQNGRGSDKGPSLVHPIYRPGHHADLSFHLAVKNGVRQHHWNFGNMAPIDGLTPEDAGHIVTYVRQQQRAGGVE